jgi:nucleoid-associated protein YgaU
VTPNIRSSLRLAVIVLVAGIFLGLVAPALFASDEAVSKPRTHVVQAGETLWDLAKTHAPSEDPRRFIFEVQRMNDLEGALIQPGATLRLPSN